MLITERLWAWCRYACFYITRTCFNYVNPIMLKDASLGIDLTAIGFISSLLPIAYAFSKGISGFLGSTTSSRVLLAGGLAATGVACLGFGFGNSPLWFAAFWTVNGLLQVCLPSLGSDHPTASHCCRFCFIVHVRCVSPSSAVVCRAWVRLLAPSC